MTALQHLAAGTHYAVHLPEPDDFDLWRERARALVQADVPPDRVMWSEPGGAGDLFAADGAAGGALRLPSPPPGVPPVRANRRFVELARSVVLHRDRARFDLLYRLLWRLQHTPGIMEDKADLDVRRAEDLAKAVRRDIHKMRAFVRFRVVESDEAEAGEHYVAWFEPEHHILRANAAFFVRRFATMRWSILTPSGCLHWDGAVLEEGPPAERSDAPAGDPAEDLWRTYYASIFNPARLKIGAMVKEMPRKYWKNLPEAELIPQLIAGAQAREAAMVAAGGQGDYGPRPATLALLSEGLHACRACPIGGLENRAVMGEGPPQTMGHAALMIVGEQPGDQEDEAGRPFVGPAGQVLDRHLAQAGIDRSAAYVTNAVKHFKYTVQNSARGKRRLHQSPTAKEIDICRWWLENERALVRPQLVLALGASAARSLLGRTVSVGRERGRAIALEDGSELWVTVHPSYLLRLDGDAQAEQERLFARDLAAVQARLAELEG